MKGENNKINFTKIKKLFVLIFIVAMIVGSTRQVDAINFPWDWLFPKAIISDALNMGTISQENKLEATPDCVKTDEHGNKYIEWTYTSKVEKKKSPSVTTTEPENPSLSRYFITGAESGLGEPEILSISKNGQTLDLPQTSGSGKSDIFVSKKQDIDLSKDQNYGTYVYKIKTPILGYRDNYVLDVNSVLTGKFKKGRTVNIGGVTRKLTKDETVAVALPNRVNVSRKLYEGFNEDRSNKIEITTGYENGKTVYGEYYGENNINWISSYLNEDRYPKDTSIELKPDDSQEVQKMTVYYLKPGKEGYEVDESLTKEYTNVTGVKIENLPPGWIVQARLETKIKIDRDAPTKNHIVADGQGNQLSRLESLFANMTIEKKWAEDVQQNEKKDVLFNVSGGRFGKSGYTKKANDRDPKLYFTKVKKFEKEFSEPASEYRRIAYEVEEDVPAGFDLAFKGENKYTLTYLFKNEKEKGSVTPGGGEGDQQCSAYGLKSIEKIDINQYWFEDELYLGIFRGSKKDGWAGYGGIINGVLHIPKNAGPGQSITVKLPEEIRYESPAATSRPVGRIVRGNTHIGDIYYESNNTIRFVFNEKAPNSEDYDVNFQIGEYGASKENKLKRKNGVDLTEQELNRKWPIGIEPVRNKFYPAERIKESVTKSLPFESTYYNYGGVQGSCGTKVLNQDVTLHLEDKQVHEESKYIEKYVVEEGDDYIIWEVVYNSVNNWVDPKDTDFYDFLGESVELYHGNNTASFPQDIELYMVDIGTRSGSYVDDYKYMVYPYGGNARVTGEVNNQKIHGLFNKVYQLTFIVPNLQDDTLVARIKTKKLKTLRVGKEYNTDDSNVRSYYYNHAQSMQAGREKIYDYGNNEWVYKPIKTARYAPKKTKAGSIDQGRYGFSLQKTERVKLANGNFEERPIINNPAEFRATKEDGRQTVTAKADANGVVKFDDLEAGTFIVQEIKPPSGYVGSSDPLKFKITVLDADTEEVDAIRYKVEYKKGSDEWKQWSEGQPLPTVVNTPKPTLRVRKVDAVTKEPINGAKFRLKEFTLDNKQGYEKVSEGSDFSEFSFGSLNEGKYYLEEIQAPAGYDKIAPIWLEVLNIPGQGIKISRMDWQGDPAPKELPKEGGYYTLFVPNRKASEIKIKKINQYANPIKTFDPANNAEFDLYAEDTGKPVGEIGSFDFEYNVMDETGDYQKKEYTLADGTKMWARKAHGVLVTKSEYGGGKLVTTDVLWITPDQRKVSSEGMLRFDNLPDGRYFVKEIKAPKGYKQLAYPVPFVIENGKLKGDFPGYLPIVNIADKGKFRIEKVNQEGRNLSGAVFTLYKKDPNSNNAMKGAQVSSQITDYYGLANFENLDEGEYILEETTPPRGMDGEGPWHVFVDKNKRVAILDDDGNKLSQLKEIDNSDGDKEKIPVIRIVNSKKYNIIIRKRDKEQVDVSSSNSPEGYDGDKQPALNASENFKVLKAKFELLDSNKQSLAPQKIGTTEGDGPNKGLLRFEGLRPGDYYLRELESPEGYVGLEGDWGFNLSTDGTMTPLDKGSLDNANIKIFALANHDINIIAKNQIPKYSFKIAKVDQYGNPIAMTSNQARFAICDEDGNQIGGQVANLANGVFEFKNDGQAYFRPGKYSIKEVTPPTANGKQYDPIQPNPIKFLLKANGEIEVLDQIGRDYMFWGGLEKTKGEEAKKYYGKVEIKVKNAFTKDLKISKKISGKTTKPDGKVSFKLTNDQSGLVRIKADQNAKNDIVFNKLFPGVYTLVETKAPLGFAKEDALYKVFVSDSGVDVYEVEGSETNQRIDGLSLIKSNDFSNIVDKLKYSDSYAVDKELKGPSYTVWSNFNGQGNNIPVGAWFGVKLPEIAFVSQVAFAMGSPGNPTDRMDDMRLEYSLDGVNYKVFKNYTSAELKKVDQNESAPRLLYDDLNQYARYIRIVNNQVRNNKWMGVQDIQINGLSYNELNKDGDKIEVKNRENPNFNLIKTDMEGNNIDPSGTKFELRKVYDYINSSKDLKENIGKLVYKIELSKTGTVFLTPEETPLSSNKLPLDTIGKYILVEKQAPRGHKRLSSPILLDFYEKNTQNGNTIIESTGIRVVDVSSARYASVTESNNTINLKVKNDKLPSADFALSKRIKGLELLTGLLNGKKVRFKLTNTWMNPTDPYATLEPDEANANDIIAFNGIDEGIYRLYETLVPDGYVRDASSKVMVHRDFSASLYTDIENTDYAINNGKVKLTTDIARDDQIVNKNAAIDGNEDSQAVFKPDDSVIKKDKSINLELDGVYEVNSLRIIQDKNSGGGNDAFDKISIEYSVDGSNYKTYKAYENSNKPNKPNTISDINEPKTSILAKYIRIKNIEDSGSRRWLKLNEIKLNGHKVKVVADLPRAKQKSLAYKKEENLFKIGNIQNPKLGLEKIDENGNRISSNKAGKAYSAKFVLYKVRENRNEIDTNELNQIQANKLPTDFTEIASYDLTNGYKEFDQKVSDLGRYALVEVEAPDGYEKVEPILMDLVETSQNHNAQLKKHTTAWKIVGDSKNYGTANTNLPTFTGESDLANVKVDYNSLSQNKIILKVKNKKLPTGAFKLQKAIKTDVATQGSFSEGTSLEVEFKLSKDDDNSFRQIVKKQSANKEFVFENLMEGVYTLEESIAPNNYIKNPDPYKVFVDSNGNAAVVEKLENKNGKINLTKDNLILSAGLTNRNTENGSGTLDAIFDNDEKTYIKMITDSSKILADDYVGVDLKSPYLISKLRFCQGSNGVGNHGNDAFDKMVVEYSLDGKTYYQLGKERINDKKGVGTGKPNSLDNVEETDQHIVARYIRFRNTELATGRWMMIREISLEGAKLEKGAASIIKYVPNGKASDEKEKVFIPNIQIPDLDLEKVDTSGNLISANNNSGYTATFALYKVKDDRTKLSENEKNSLNLPSDFIKKQEFTIKDGKLSNISQTIDEFGRYALVETQAPAGYENTEPIFMDLVKSKISLLPGINAITSTWKLVSDNTKPNGEYYSFANSKNDDSAIIDYSKMGAINSTSKRGSIKIKVKNKKIVGGFTLVKRIKGLENITNNLLTGKTAKFKISQAGKTIKEANTDRDAKINFENLAPGEYKLEESQAPEGYIKEDKAYDILIQRDGTTSIYEAETEKTLANSDIELTKNMSGSVENQAHAIDGNEDTQAIFRPSQSTIRNGEYLQLNLKTPYKINKLEIVQDKNGGGGNDAFDKMAIEYSQDGRNYKTLEIYENQTKTGNGKPNTIANISEEKPNIIAQYIRFKSLKDSGSRWLRINEIKVKGQKAKILQTIEKGSQTGQENNLVKIGNIQNPEIEMEKIDEDGNKITTNNTNKNYNAKFSLYKLKNDQATSVSENDLNQANKIQDFELNSGTLGKTTQKANQLGRYALVETENPEGYEKVEPILMDLVETRQNHDASKKKHTTAWAIVGETVAKDSEGYATFAGEKALAKVKIDYTGLSQNKIVLKVKNKKGAKKVKLKIIKTDKEGNTIGGNNSTSARFFISKTKTSDENDKYNGQVANLTDNGSFTFKNKNDSLFEPGFYYLVESRGPKGFAKLSTPIPFYIERNGNVIIPAKEENGKYVEDTKFLYSKYISVEQANDKDTLVTVKIKNDKLSYPNAGGFGSQKFLIYGTLVMVLSIFLYYRRKHTNFAK